MGISLPRHFIEVFNRATGEVHHHRPLPAPDKSTYFAVSEAGELCSLSDSSCRPSGARPRWLLTPAGGQITCVGCAYLPHDTPFEVRVGFHGTDGPVYPAWERYTAPHSPALPSAS